MTMGCHSKEMQEADIVLKTLFPQLMIDHLDYILCQDKCLLNSIPQHTSN